MINLIALVLHLEGKEQCHFSAMNEPEEKSEDNGNIEPGTNAIGAVAPSQMNNEPGQSAHVIR